MNWNLSRREVLASALLLTVCGAPLALRAQSDDAPNPNKILVIQREFTKPGRDGTSHQTTEAAFKRAAEAGKAPFHYVAVTSLTGPNRALFLSAYPSFAAVEEERKHIGAALGASLDKAMVTDGDMLTAQDASTWIVRPELSTNTKGMRVGSRFLIAREYVIKPGHNEEWKEAVKIIKDGYAQSTPEAHWTMYQMAFGNSTGPTYLVLTALKSMDEMDGMFAPNPKFDEVVGADGLKRLDKLEASSIESQKSNVFVVDPKMSIPTEDMINAEPDFWHPKSASVARKPAKEKPSTGQ